MRPKTFFIITGILLSGLLLTGCGIDVRGLNLTIKAEPVFFTEAGEEITFTYVVEFDSTGGSSYINLQPFSETMVYSNSESVAIGGGWNKSVRTWTDVYTVTDEDVLAGKIVHSSTVKVGRGSTCCGPRKPAEASDTIEVLLGEQPELSLTISGTPQTFPQAGTEIEYEFHVLNSGNVEFKDPIVVDDSLTHQVDCPQEGPLSPGDAILCTATYTTTADDVWNFFIINKATAFAGEIRSEQTELIIWIEPQPALDLAITSSTGYFVEVGNPIDFNYVITNIGNVVVVGPFEIISETVNTSHCDSDYRIDHEQPFRLERGESITCQGTYWVTAADIGEPFTHVAHARGFHVEKIVDSPEASITIVFLAPTEPPKCSQYQSLEAYKLQVGYGKGVLRQ